MKKKETELSKPEALKRAIAGVKAPFHHTLEDAILRLVQESEREVKKSNSQILRAISNDEIANKTCEDMRGEHLVACVRRIVDGDRDASIVRNYISHLSSVFAIAWPAWNYSFDAQTVADASKVCKMLGYTSKSRQRDRRRWIPR